jgi:hypothetical protein
MGSSSNPFFLDNRLVRHGDELPARILSHDTRVWDLDISTALHAWISDYEGKFDVREHDFSKCGISVLTGDLKERRTRRCRVLLTQLLELRAGEALTAPRLPPQPPSLTPE